MKTILFLVGSLTLLLASRRSLLRVRSHGFYRFFAWEAILGLLVLHGDRWFHDPLALHQLMSWLFLTLSIYPAVAGALMLHRAPRRDSGCDDGVTYAFERTATLVTTGIFRHIRHPMYSSLLLLSWGVFWKDPSWPGFLLAVCASAFLLATAKVEEAENLRVFGSGYTEYSRRTKRFIPRII
jgi:protein-S-isoprenylcysteine O-methyltransferase Ste14